MACSGTSSTVFSNEVERIEEGTRLILDHQMDVGAGGTAAGCHLRQDLARHYEVDYCYPLRAGPRVSILHRLRPLMSVVVRHLALDHPAQIRLRVFRAGEGANPARRHADIGDPPMND